MTIRRTLGEVPEFSLYGEAITEIDAEFVHIELIEARSRRYDWDIGSHIHRGLFQVLILLEGRVEAHVDDAQWELEAPVALCIPPTTVHGFQFAAESHGFVLTVAESLLFDGGDTGAALFEVLTREPCAVDLTTMPQARERIESLLGQLMSEACWPLQGHTLMLEWLVRCVLLLLVRLHANQHEEEHGSGRAELELFTRFRALVEAHYKEHWDIPRYAERLHIEESRLNRLCRKLTQKTAFEIVRDRLMLEARRKLTYVPASVSHIAYELGFSDPGYFNRVFKQYSGETPGAFRRRVGQGGVSLGEP